MHHRTRQIFQSLYRSKQLRSPKFLALILICLVLILTYFLVTSLKQSTFDPKQTAEKMAQSCKHDLSNQCLKSALTTFASKHPFSESKQIIDQLQILQPETRYCHTLAHAVSIAEVKKNPQNWLNLFTLVPDSECSYGYFHGVIEGKYAIDPDYKVDAGVVRDVCLKTIDQNRAQRSCAHAFGHILLTEEQGDLKKTISLCHQTAPSIAQPCIQGVFMENIQKENLSLHHAQTKPLWNLDYYKEQKKLCNQFAALEQTECWRSLSPLINHLAPQNPLNMSIFCDQAPLESAMRACKREVLGQYLVTSLSTQTPLPETICQTSQNNSSQCISDLIDYVLLTSIQLRQALINNFCPTLKQESEVIFCRQRANDFKIN